MIDVCQNEPSVVCIIIVVIMFVIVVHDELDFPDQFLYELQCKSIVVSQGFYSLYGYMHFHFPWTESWLFIILSARYLFELEFQDNVVTLFDMLEVGTNLSSVGIQISLRNY